MLADYLEWQRQDYQEALEAVRQGREDVKALVARDLPRISSTSSHESVDFRDELSDQAQRDIAAIYDWLHSQQAGDAGARWFVTLRGAIASLASLSSRCPLAPENRDLCLLSRPVGRKIGRGKSRGR